MEPSDRCARTIWKWTCSGGLEVNWEVSMPGNFICGVSYMVNDLVRDSAIILEKVVIRCLCRGSYLLHNRLS